VIHINSRQTFQQLLADLPVQQQRQVGARFVGNVLGLTQDPRFRNCVTLLARSGLSAQELVDGYHSIHAVNVATHPRSDLSELNYALQAEHFVAEACLVCLSPVYEETRKHHLAEKAAMYCRMARTCAAINHDEERPCLSAAENLLAQEIQDQYKILSGFLNQQ